jgi:16S rRNA (uracil1498-N3)-methyltransferase
MDLILQKATELGVTAIVPLTMARSTVRLDAKSAATKQQHWQAVAISACEQCGRNTVPVVHAPQALDEALRAATDLGLMLRPDEDSLGLSDLLAPATQDQPIHLLVGPEGGFDPAEITLARNAGFRSCRLGPRILRTETAGLAALAALQSLAGDLR